MRRNGKEIFYQSPDNKLMSATVSSQGSAFQVGEARPLFDARPAVSSTRDFYDVSPDGQWFLVHTAEAQAAPPITLIVNWPALLKK